MRLSPTLVPQIFFFGKSSSAVASCSWPTSRLRAQRCVNVGVLRASCVVVGFWWDPVCRLLHLRARELLITGEYRARVLLVLLPGCIR